MNRAEDSGSLAGVVINLDLAQVTVIPKNDANGVCLTAMRTLQSMSTIKTRTGTQVTLTKTSSSRRTDSCTSSVSHLASYYSHKFAKFQRIHLPGVSDIPIGTFVLVLRQDANDKGWAPVVVNETLDGRKYARFTWMHPECLEHLETGNDGCVVIGHTDRRRRHMASYGFADWDPGIRRYRGQLVLDARWSGAMNTGNRKGSLQNW